MTDPAPLQPGRWLDGELPPNVQLGANTVLRDPHLFHRFRSKKHPALVIGQHCTMDGVHFALGEEASVQIGDYCYFSNSLLLSELELRIGSYVVMGWNSTIADSDFHPISPAQRVLDAIASSPLGQGRPRPPLPTKAVIIEDDVWIGPNVTIFKGVRVGAGSFIEPGALLTRDIPPRSRVMGNPAHVVGTT